jgi:hypothetical protein
VEIDHTSETKRAKSRQTQRYGGGDIPQRVAAAVAVPAGVRQLANANTVEDDEDDSAQIQRRRGRRQASWVE